MRERWSVVKKRHRLGRQAVRGQAQIGVDTEVYAIRDKLNGKFFCHSYVLENSANATLENWMRTLAKHKDADKLIEWNEVSTVDQTVIHAKVV